MPKPKKTLYIFLILAVIVIILVIGVILFKKTPAICGGIAGIGCPKGYTCKYEQLDKNIVTTDAFGICVLEKKEKPPTSEPVEYNQSYGTVCPTYVKFLVNSSSKSIGCKCPNGFKFESEVIGYEQGCAGPGSECPTYSRECIKENTQSK